MFDSAVSYISAKISRKIISALLASEEGQKALIRWLQSQFKEVEVLSTGLEYGLVLEIQDAHTDGLYQVSFLMSGEVIIRGV